MKYVIDEYICTKENLSMPEVITMMLIKMNVNISEIINNLEDKEIIIKDIYNNYFLTQRWNDVLSSVLLDSEVSNVELRDIELEELAKELMAIFPKGKKEGTNVYWKGNLKDTKLRLKKFFKLYGDKFSKEQIINAAKRYVDSFNGNYSFMRVLKYFIWKDIKRVDVEGKGYIEETSELATLIENEGQENVNNDWTTNLV